jgi:hypothetical protein
MLLAAVAAVGMLWAVARTFREQIAKPTSSLIAYAWSAAIWLPLLFVLWSEHAAWVLIAPVPVAAILTHFTRRQNLALSVVDDEADFSPSLAVPARQIGGTSFLRYRSALFATKANEGRAALFASAAMPRPLPIGLPAVGLALLLQAACFTFAVDMPALSESFLIVLTAATVWLFTTVPPAVPGQTSPVGTRTRRAAVLPCFLLTCLALTPLLQAGLNAGVFSNAVMAGAMAVAPPQIKRSEQHAYAGIILMAPPTPKHKLLTPEPASLTTNGFRPSRPLTIPFDGAYRYFEVYPMPGARGVHMQRGDPTKANVRSVGMSPLTMEAHQRLGNRINASCCRGIDVNITNADNRLGRIDIEMLLQDIAPRGATVTRSLGAVPIRSSLEQRISIDRAPVNETLHFHIAANDSQLRFNNIILRFKLSAHRNLGGAKVRVKDFKLMP